MALIVELHDARGLVARHRLDGCALTFGRGLGNDVILDDPYVDACHARIARDEAGAWSIADLGSVNGLSADGTRVDAAIPVKAGTEVRIGRTLLRFRDTEEAVAPALVEDHAPSAPTPLVTPGIAPAPVAEEEAPTTVRRLVGAVLETTRGRLVVVGVMLASFAVNAWLGDATRSPAGSVFAMLVALFAFAALWATGWAIATRRVDRRVHFLGHLAVVSATLLGALVAAEIVEWLTFLFPDAPLVYLLGGAVYLALAAALVAGHLGVSGTLPPPRRWRAGAMVSGAIVALMILAAIAVDDTFSDTPELASALKPLSPAFIPAGSVDEFGSAIRKARSEADDALKESESP
jgi:pSer/pThr/pTyr-binding forkhead associated (FHA) protein